jgi:ABC-type Fe3+ transport system permease subunit
LNDFISERLETAQDEQIRIHLDHCTDCVTALVNEKRVEMAASRRENHLSNEFSQRVAAEFPESGTSAILFHYLCGIFAASAFIAVACYAFVRQRLRPANLSSVSPPWERADLEAFYPWLSSLLNSPTLHSVLLGLAAVLLSIGLVVLVDRPRQNHVVISVGRNGD